MNAALLEQLAALIGHKLSPRNERSLIEAIDRAATRAGVGPEQLVRRAVSGDSAAFRDLVAAVMVGETYFFRHEEDFGLLNRLAREAAANGAPYQTSWSVGCATGEEAYSIASVLLSSWRAATVCGSDISAAALDAARTGRYRRWSFRARAPATIFGLRADGEEWEVSQPLRDAVSFHPLNLARDPIVPPPPLPAEVDVIFCRNVLIYLDATLAQKVIHALAQRVTPGGLLVLGALEGPAIAPPGFDRPRAADGSAFVRRRAQPAPAARPRPSSVRPPLVAAQRRPPDPDAPLIGDARRLADAGDVDGALTLLQSAGDNVRALELAATILIDRGAIDAAEQRLARLLQLDPGSTLGHLRMVLLATRGRDLARAAIHGQALGQLLAARPEDSEVEVVGLTVGDIRRLIADVLPEASR